MLVEDRDSLLAHRLFDGMSCFAAGFKSVYDAGQFVSQLLCVSVVFVRETTAKTTKHNSEDSPCAYED